MQDLGATSIVQAWQRLDAGEQRLECRTGAAQVRGWGTVLRWGARRMPMPACCGLFPCCSAWHASAPSNAQLNPARPILCPPAPLPLQAEGGVHDLHTFDKRSW